MLYNNILFNGQNEYNFVKHIALYYRGNECLYAQPEKSNNSHVR